MQLPRIAPDRRAVEATPPRRIAIFTGNYADVRDGVALTLNRLVDWLLARGDDVRVVCPEPGPDRFMEPTGRIIGVPAVSWVLQPEYKMALPTGFRRELRRFEPELIHLATPDFLGMAGLAFAKRRRVPAVASFHSNIMSYLQYNGSQQILERSGWQALRVFYAGCEQLYVPTESMANELARRKVGRNYRLWERGIEPERFNPRRRSLEFRARHGVDEHEPLVTFVARLRWEKGLRTLAAALNSVARDGPPHKTMVVGDGVGLEWLREQLPETIFTGALIGDDLAEAYASSDLFVYPSTTDTFGNVTLEAMASGLPTICADAPGSKDLVVDGQTGLLCEGDNPEAFASAIRALLDDPVRLRGMGHAALKRSKSFTWDENMARISSYYDEVLFKGA